MDAFQTLMFYQLPPVGNTVCLHASGSVEADSCVATLFASERTQFYASGTAALAAAVVAAMKIKNIDSAEVVLPAYGCPDLISAVEFSGARPVLVDFEVDRPWLDLMQMSSAITGNTVAIVAVNLFGISERWPQLRELADKNDLVLIEDSAQYFPGGEEQQEWQSDLVVFSFGRGKPVSLLGGGAVIANKTSLFELLPQPKRRVTTLYQRLLYDLKGMLYNIVISPYLYWLPQSLPFLHLGETRYHKLEAIEAMDERRMGILPVNLLRYQRDVDAYRLCEKISSMLESLTDQYELINLPFVCNAEKNRRLLRYPLLLKTGLRDSAYQKLKQAGLGVSIMYPEVLTKVSGVNHLLDDKQYFPNAESFALRVLTLPTHANVSENAIDKMKAILNELR